MIKFSVNGTPVPQGSGFVTGKHGQVFSPRAVKVNPWRSDIATEAGRVCPVPLPGPVAVLIGFRVKRPKNHYRTGRNAHLLKDGAPGYPDGKPDIDKLARAVLDALTGVVFWDDAQVVTLGVSKGYADIPGADLEISEMTP